MTFRAWHSFIRNVKIIKTSSFMNKPWFVYVCRNCSHFCSYVEDVCKDMWELLYIIWLQYFPFMSLGSFTANVFLFHYQNEYNATFCSRAIQGVLKYEQLKYVHEKIQNILKIVIISNRSSIKQPLYTLRVWIVFVSY